MADFPIKDNPEFSGTMTKLTSKDRGAYDVFNTRYQTLLDSDNYLKKRADRADHTTPVTLLAANWSASAPYTQTVGVPGLTAGDSPLLVKRIASSATSAQVKAYNKAFGMIDDGDTADGTAVFKCYSKKPTIDFSVGLKGV